MRVTERLGGLFIDVNARDRGNLAQATNSFLETQLDEAREQLEAQEARLTQFRERYAGRLPTQLDFNMSALTNAQQRAQSLIESMARDRDQKLLLETTYAELNAQEIAPPPPPGSASSAGHRNVNDSGTGSDSEHDDEAGARVGASTTGRPRTSAEGRAPGRRTNEVNHRQA